MLWYGMWYVMVWYVMVWCGVVWWGIARWARWPDEPDGPPGPMGARWDCISRWPGESPDGFLFCARDGPGSQMGPMGFISRWPRWGSFPDGPDGVHFPMGLACRPMGFISRWADFVAVPMGSFSRWARWLPKPDGTYGPRAPSPSGQKLPRPPQSEPVSSQGPSK